MIYILITFIIFVFSFLELTSLKQKTVVFLLGVVVMVLFAGLRYQIGVDWGIYEGKFRGDDVAMVEVVYNFIIELSKFIYNDFSVNIFIVAGLAVILKARGIFSLAPMPLIGLFFYYGMFYYPQEFNQMRQGLAAGFCMYSILAIKDKHLVKFLIIMLIAVSIHASSIVFVLAYIIYYRFPENKKLLVTILLISIPFMFIDIGGVLIGFVTNIVLKIIPLPIATERMTSYLSSVYAVKHGFYAGALFLIYFAFLFIGKLNKIESPVFRGVTKCYVLGLSLNFIVNSISILERFTFYYLLLGAILYPFVICHDQKFIKKLMHFCILSLILFLKIYSFLSDPESILYYIPYRSILSR